jgi:hypothetical protein
MLEPMLMNPSRTPDKILKPREPAQFRSSGAGIINRWGFSRSNQERERLLPYVTRHLRDERAHNRLKIDELFPSSKSCVIAVSGVRFGGDSS